MNQDISIKQFHPVLDKDLLRLTCIYCNRMLSRIDDILFCPNCRISFRKESGYGNPDSIVPDRNIDRSSKPKETS